MMIFIALQDDKEKKNVLVIPQNKIDFVKMYDNEIRIVYRTGNFEAFTEENNSPIERQEHITLFYNSQDDALTAMRDFYIACEKKAGAFTFKKYNGKNYVYVNDFNQ